MFIGNKQKEKCVSLFMDCVSNINNNIMCNN